MLEYLFKYRPYYGPISRIMCVADDARLKLHDYAWNKDSKNSATCMICGETLTPKKIKYSPEQGGWKYIKETNGWLCHRCIDHRQFQDYIQLIDLDEEIMWCGHDENRKIELIKKRTAILNGMMNDNE